VPWSTSFEDPIILPDGRKLLTLKDAADYVTKLPKKESDLPEWQAAIEALMLCSRGGDAMLARIGVVKALNRHVERVFNTDAKERHLGKRKLKRDQSSRELVTGPELKPGRAEIGCCTGVECWPLQ
jgi:hypothetical protein